MFQSLFALPTPLEVVFTVGPVTRDVEETWSLISSLRSMLFKHVKTNFVHFEKCLWIICYPERIIGLKFCGDSNIKHPRFCQKQGRNMVYPGPIDPNFLAVILIPEPHFPKILIPEP